MFNLLNLNNFSFVTRNITQRELYYFAIANVSMFSQFYKENEWNIEFNVNKLIQLIFLSCFSGTNSQISLSGKHKACLLSGYSLIGNYKGLLRIDFIYAEKHTRSLPECFLHVRKSKEWLLKQMLYLRKHKQLLPRGNL